MMSPYVAEPFSIDGQYWAHLFCEEMKLSEHRDSKAAERWELEESDLKEMAIQYSFSNFSQDLSSPEKAEIA